MITYGTYRVVGDAPEVGGLEAPEDAVVIPQQIPEEQTEPTVINNYIMPEKSFIDKYGLYVVIGVVLLIMVLMYVFRKKIA